VDCVGHIVVPEVRVLGFKINVAQAVARSVGDLRPGRRARARRTTKTGAQSGLPP